VRHPRIAHLTAGSAAPLWNDPDMPIDHHLLAAFVVTTIVAMLAPGPDMLFVLGCGMRGGARAGLLATAGVATSEAVHIAVAAAGLTALFAAVPVAFTVVRVAGAAYLICRPAAPRCW
jgi:threonine/homoserine/homoserine lactone efflux protein